MKLGEMLVRDGRITEDQVRDALAAQRQYGGRLGTVMVELGMIDLDALTVYLGLELGIPIATGAMLERAKRSAVRLLTPDQAFKFKCVPLIVQDRQLIAALEDPLDLELLDELSHAGGYRIIPRIAPEIRIYYYVERYFGVPRPQRFVIFGDSPRSQQAPAADLPAPPLPGLPPLTTTPVRAPTPLPTLQTMAAMAHARGRRISVDSGFEESEAIELEADDLLDELETDVAATADVAPAARAAPGLAPGAVRAESDPGVAVDTEALEPLSFEQTLSAMRGATQRGDIAEAMMRFAAGVFDTAVLFIVRDGMAFGWKGLGPQLAKDRFETLLIPLEVPSMFQAAAQAALESGAQSKGGVVHDAPVPSTLHNHLLKVLRCRPPACSTVAAVSIGRRVVNVLYGHRIGRDELTADEIDQLRKVCAAATNAYVRLIAVSKKG